MPSSSDKAMRRSIKGPVLSGACIPVLSAALLLVLSAPLLLAPTAQAQNNDGLGGDTVQSDQIQQVPLSRGAIGAGLGILDPGRDGGLPLTLWGSTDAALASALVRNTPGDVKIPELRDLARRALASTAIAPRGSTAQFALDRSAALIRLGFLDEAASLARAARMAQPARADRLRATALLLEGDENGACVVLREANRDDDPAGINDDGFLDRLDLLCQLADGNTGAANFLINLLREAGDTRDDVLVAASALAADSQIDSMLGAIDPARQPVAFTILTKAGATLADDAPLLTRLAHLNQQDRDLKDVPGALDSLIILARHGWLPDDGFQGRLASAGFRTADYEDPLGTADQGTPGEAALLLSALASETLDAAKAQLWLAAWDRAKPIDGALIPAFIDSLATIQPGPGTETLAPVAFFLLASYGEADRAARWLRQAGQHPATGIASVAYRLAQPSGSIPNLPTGDAVNPIRSLVLAAAVGTGLAPTTGFLAKALDHPISESASETAALSALLSAPKDETGLGQHIMAALLLAGNRDISALPLVTLGVLTDAIRRGGLAEAARRMARQAVLNASMAADLDGTKAASD